MTLFAVWLPWLAGILLVVLGQRPTVAVRRLAALLVLGGSLVLLAWLGWRQEEAVFFAGRSLRWDRYALFVQLLVLFCATASLGLGGRGERKKDQEALLLLATSGGCFLSVANDLVALLAGVAAFSAPAWILAAQEGRRGREAAMKALLALLPAAALAGLGAALCMFWAGSTDLDAMTSWLQRSPDGSVALMRVALLMWLAGLAAMLAAAPCHMWFVDLVHGQPAAGVGLLGGWLLVAMLAAAGRVMLAGFGQAPDGGALSWPAILHTIGFVSLLVGNLAALVQRRLKRMLANLAVGQVGFFLIGLAAAGELRRTADLAHGVLSSSPAAEAAGALLVFLLVCGLTWIGFCLPLGLSRGEPGEELTVDDLTDLFWRAPGLALVVGLSLLCAAGMPPTVGFQARFWMLEAMVDAGWTVTALLAALSLGLVMATSLGWVAAMVRRGGQPEPPPRVPAALKLVAAVVGGALVALTFLPSGVFDAAVRAARSIF